MTGNDMEYQRLKDLGNEKFRNKQFEEAKKLYTEAIASKRDEPTAYLNRAACNINLKLFFDALEDCNAALKLDPKLFKGYYRRAVALRNLSRLNLARIDFKKASELDPQSKLVKDELAKLEAMFSQNDRIDVKCHEKPERFRSKKALTTFELQGQYSGMRQYDLSKA